MRLHPNVLSRRLHSFLGEGDILREARAAGFGQRNRKCTPVLFFWTLVFGVNAQAQRTLSSLRRFFISVSGRSITSAAFQKRFTDEAAEMFRRVFECLLEKSLVVTPRALPRKLRRFRDLLTVDSTAFALHDKLSRHFEGCRAPGSRAVARVSVTFGLSDHRLRAADVTPGRVSERNFFPSVDALRGHLVLFDLGYTSRALLQQLKAAGARFITRSRKNSILEILAIHRGARPRHRYVGRKVRDASFRGTWVDLDVCWASRGQSVRLRLVGRWNHEIGRYRFYFTNLPRDSFSPEEVTETYRLRWQVELLFKELKSICRLAQIPTRRPAGVLCLIYATLIVHLLSRFLGCLLMRWTPWEHSPMRWTLFLLTFAARLARQIARHDDHGIGSTLREMARSGPIECRRSDSGGGRIYGAHIS